MEISMTNLALVALFATVLGLFLGMAYDVVRIARVALGISSYGGKKLFLKIYSSGVRNVFVFKRNRIFDCVAVGIGDVLFFFFAGVAFSIFLYRFNFGRFRWFIFLFCILGFLAYYFSIGKLVIHFSGIISQFVILVTNLLLLLLFLPFRLLAKLFVWIYRKSVLTTIGKIKNKVDKAKRKRYTDKCIRKIPDYVKFKV